MSITQTADTLVNKVRKITFGWNDDTGSDPAPLAVSGLNGIVAHVDLTSSGLSAAYTVTINKGSSTGIDILMGAGASASHTADSRVFPAVSGVPVISCIRNDNVYIKVTGADVSTSGTISLYLIQE